MSKTLIIVRHAKSSWDHPGISDHDRPLNQRGERDAPEMGRRLAATGVAPERIICSSANRAQRTAREIAAALDYPEADITVEPALYGAGSRDIIELLQGLDEGLATVMVVAHNPTLTSLVNRLSGSDIDNIPTCGIATLGLKGDSWGEVGINSCELLDFDYPKRES